jgi:hypothetical protein
MIDTNVLWIRAEGALRAGRHADAQIYLRQLVQVVERIDFEYEEWLRAFADSLRASGHWGEAMACLAYLGARELPGPEVLQAQVPMARSGDPDALRAVRLYGIYLARAGQHRVAASWFSLGAMPVHQAIELERAKEDEAAAQLWARLLTSDLLADRGASRPPPGASSRTTGEPARGHAYERALAKINFGLCLRRLAASDRRRPDARPGPHRPRRGDHLRRGGRRHLRERGPARARVRLLPADRPPRRRGRRLREHRRGLPQQRPHPPRRRPQARRPAPLRDLRRARPRGAASTTPSPRSSARPPTTAPAPA